MKQSVFEILDNTEIAKHTFRMLLSGDTSAISRPGQFVNLALPGKFLRRPISVCDWETGRLTLIYKTVGAGTEQLSGMKSGEKLDLLTGLGNGYEVSVCGDAPLLVGGGVGVPPLYALCKELLALQKQVTVVLGFNEKAECFYEEAFSALGAKVCVTTADGSYGKRGFVTDGMQSTYSYFYACGPLPMLRAVNRIAVTEGQISMEERMGCGFGACMGCSCETLVGAKRICRDGPVFKRSEILW